MLAPPGARVMCCFKLWGSRNKGPAEGAREERGANLQGEAMQSPAAQERNREAAGQPSGLLRPSFLPPAAETLSRLWQNFIHRGMDKDNVVHIHNYYSGIRKNEIMPFAATWMDLGIILLSEVSQKKTNIT